MARKKPEYRCTAEYTEGCDKRLTEALVDIYYNRLKGISGGNLEKIEKEKTEDPA